MRLVLEKVGGFTGPAGKQVTNVDLAQLSSSDATEIRQLLSRVPDQAWGKTFYAPHPKPWDFRHSLTVQEDGKEKEVVFHLNQGPPELTKIVELLGHQDSVG